MLFVFLGIGCSKEKKSELVSTIKEYKGYIRLVAQEEYEFYEYFVKRNVTDTITEKEFKEQVKKYANEVNAVFYLGNKLNLCEPYSFELLQIRMEQENDIRKVKKEKGEAIYGLEQFNLQNYFQYTLDNLELDIIEYILQNADEAIVDDAEAYFERNKASFKVRESVVYESTIDGETNEVTAAREELNFMGKSDMGLADFLETAEIGEEYEDTLNGSQRKVVVKEITYYEPEFKENESAMIQNYIQAELYPELIETVAKNNQVEFELDR